MCTLTKIVLKVLPLVDGSGLDPEKLLYVYDDLSLTDSQIYKFVLTLDSTVAAKQLDLKVNT